MRKYFFFITSFAGALLLFIGLSNLVLLLSNPKNIPPQQPNSNNEKAQPLVRKNGKPHSVIAVFQNETDIYISVVDIYSDTVAVTALDSNTPHRGSSLGQILSQEGLYPFIAACKQRISGRQTVSFIKFTPESFKKVADTQAGLVYNYHGNEQILLTSVQALEMMDCQLFSKFALQTISETIDDDTLTAFRLIVNCCENDFSYPKMYQLFHERKQE